MEGQAVLLLGTFNAAGWSELFTVRLVTFEETGLPFDSSDRMVWRFVQNHKFRLSGKLRINCKQQGENSRHQLIILATEYLPQFLLAWFKYP